jgi:hypothetical protein
MNQLIENIIDKASISFQMIHDVNTTIEQLCQETKNSNVITITVEDECLNVNIKLGENHAYTQIAMSEIYARVMKCNTVNYYEKILEIVGEGINHNIMEYANYAK